MDVHFFTDAEGREMAVMPRVDFERLSAAAEHSRAVADYETGRTPGLSPEETRAYVAAPTPLAFWRSYRGLTQAKLAAEAGVSQSYLSEIEAGKRNGPVELWLKLGHALDIPLADLVDAA